MTNKTILKFFSNARATKKEADNATSSERIKDVIRQQFALDSFCKLKAVF